MIRHLFFRSPILGMYFFSKNGKNFYNILGVNNNATKDEIKQQFHKLAKQHHPDSPNSKESDQEMFKLIVEAYNTLSDEAERIKYNRRLQDEQQYYNQTQSTQNPQYRQQTNSTTSQQRMRQQQQYYENLQKQYSQRQQNFDPQDFQAQRGQDLGEYPFLNSMRKSPELYVITAVLLVLMIRWYSYMLEERNRLSQQFSYPEDPEFIKEKNRDHMKRFGKPAYPEKRVLFKLSDMECKRIPIEILDKMEVSGKYQFTSKCFERLDEYRAQNGSHIIVGEDDDDEDYQPKRRQQRNKSQKLSGSTEQEQQQQTVNFSRARIFKPVERGINAPYISKENIDQLQRKID